MNGQEEQQRRPLVFGNGNAVVQPNPLLSFEEEMRMRLSGHTDGERSTLSLQDSFRPTPQVTDPTTTGATRPVFGEGTGGFSTGDGFGHGEDEDPVELRSNTGGGNGEEPPQRPPHRPRVHQWRHRAMIVGLVLVVLWAILFIFPIPFGTLVVTGSKDVTVDDVIAAGDIRRPVNLLQINPGHLEERLTHDLRIDTAKVTYVFPLTLQVTVTDRKPIAVVATQFGFAAIDKTGRVIRIGPAIEDTNVPLISGIKLGNVLLGDTLSEEAVKAAITYLAALNLDWRKNISEINVGDLNAITAYTTEGLPLHLGDTQNLDKKAQLTENMVTDVKTRGVNAQYLDVNINAPYIKVQQ